MTAAAERHPDWEGLPGHPDDRPSKTVVETNMETTHDCAPETCGFDPSERFIEPEDGVTWRREHGTWIYGPTDRGGMVGTQPGYYRRNVM